MAIGSLPPTPAGASQPALPWLDLAEPGTHAVAPAITAIDMQDLVRLTEQYRRIVTWD